METELKAPPSSLSLSCEDCMALMRRYPDKHFDLAIVEIYLAIVTPRYIF
jgi:hypothetical protein